MNGLLGKLPPIVDSRTLKLDDYLRPGLPEPPPRRFWQLPVSRWGVQGNDQYGNCVIATAAHLNLTWRANELGDTQPIADSATIALSREMGALNGYAILKRLNYWRKTGMFANKLWSYAAVNPKDVQMAKVAIETFGAIDIGVAMPRGWQSQEVWGTGTGAAWRAGSWGLHSIPIVGYDEEKFYCVTWGRVQPMTYEALRTYSDEAFALINPLWIAGDGVSPSGFDLTSLHADLREVTG